MNTTDKLRTERGEKRVISPPMFIGLLFSLIVVIAAFLFINSSYFTVGNVVVEGNKYLAKEEVYRIAGIPEHINIFRLNTSEIQSRLRSDLRVNSVDVSRQLPATIVIAITERRPIAYLSSNYGFVEVDKQGIVLAVHKNIKQSHIPIITGYRAGGAYVGDRIEDSQIAKQLLIFLSLLDEAAINQLSEVNINGERLTAYTTNAVNIRLGNFERLEEKAKVLGNILVEVNQKKLNVDYIDLTYASPYIKVKQ